MLELERESDIAEFDTESGMALEFEKMTTSLLETGSEGRCFEVGRYFEVVGDLERARRLDFH